MYRYDVLFMTEPLDELTVQAIGEYGGKTLTDLGKENVDFAGDDEEKAKTEEQSTDTQGACFAWVCWGGACSRGFDWLCLALGRTKLSSSTDLVRATKVACWSYAWSMPWSVVRMRPCFCVD